MARSPEDRPPVAVDYHTEDLPPLPQRDYLIPAERWVEAPPELRELGADFGVSLVAYKRRIGRYLLWRGGPASRADARYMGPAPDDPAQRDTVPLPPRRTGGGVSADGETHPGVPARERAPLPLSFNRSPP